MAPATNSETAAMRRMRRTRMRSAATSGAGGQDAPPGQLAASSACTSAALERPLTTVSDVTRRSPMVAMGRSASARSRRTCSSAPVSISRVDSWRWCRNVGGSPSRPRCSCTTSEVAPGQAKNPESRCVSSGTSAPPTMSPDAPASTAARVASSASSPSSSSWACAIGRAPERPPAQGAGRPSTAERAPDAARGDGHHQRQHRQQRDGDDESDDEARGPGGVVRPLQRVLLPGRPEDAPEAVDDELDAQQQRDGGEHERRCPEIAAQPAVEQARGDEAARQARVVEPIHAGQPGPVVAGRGVHRGVGVRPERPGPHEHRAGAGAGLAGQVDRVADRHPRPTSACDQRGITFGGGHDDDDPGVRTGREGGERVGELRMCCSTTPARLSWQPGATSRPQRITMPGPCHSSSRRAMSRQAARELSVGSGGSRRSPTTSTRRPRPTGTVRSVPGRRGRGAPHHPRVGVGSHSGPSCHLGGPGSSPQRWNRPSRGSRSAPLGSFFVLATRPERGPEQLDVARRRRHVHPGGPAVIFDIDGVLSDAAGRQHFLEHGRRDWASFFEACGDDPVIEEVARLLELLDPSLAVILLTGRPHRVQPQTLAWLKRYGLRWDLLVMRSAGDYAQVTGFKQSVVERPTGRGFDLRLAFEDDPVQPRHVRGGRRALRLHPLGVLRVAPLPRAHPATGAKTAERTRTGRSPQWS